MATTVTNPINTATQDAQVTIQPGAATTSNQPRPQSGSLYVGDLNPEVGESVLFEIFSQVGPINSIRVCRDAQTRRSLGYAYVNFRDMQDAERAIDTLNYSPIINRPCRIMWSQRDPSFRRSGVGNVFIKNLEKNIENKSLYDTFSNFGNILSCKVATDELGVSKGYGFIHYETKEAAEEAIKTLNGMMLNNKMVYVGPFLPRRERKQPNLEETFTNVYIKNILPNVSDNELKELFNTYGNTTSVVIMRDHEQNSRGFGFANFDSHENAVKAVENLHKKVISNISGDKELFVCRAQTRVERRPKLINEHMVRTRELQEKYQGLNLYVKNLDDTVDDERLHQEFSAFGTITSAKVMVDPNGIRRGFGFVCFSKPEEASKALTEMHGKLVFGKPLYVAYAQRKEHRRAQLEAQFAQRQAQYYFTQASAAGMPIPGPGMYPPNAPYYPTYPPNAAPPQRYGQFQPPPQQQQPIRRWGPGAAPGGVPQSGNVPPSGVSQPRGAYQTMPNYVMPNNQRPRGNRQTRPPQSQPNASQPSTRGPNRFVGNARNRRDGSQQGYVSNPENVDPLDPTRLVMLAPEDRKRVIGEAMFQIIHQEQEDPELAKKITGMILAANEDHTELVHLLEDRLVLQEKVREALDLLSKQSELAPPSS